MDYTIWVPIHKVNGDGFGSHARNMDKWIKVEWDMKRLSVDELKATRNLLL